MTVNLSELRQQADDLKSSMQGLIDRSNSRAPEARGLTKDEAEQFDSYNEQLDRVQGTIHRAEKLGNADTGATGRRSGHDDHRQVEGEDRSIEVRAYNPDSGEYEARTLEPDDPEYERATREYRDSWQKYLRTGGEARALNITAGDQGGYLAPMVVSSRFFQAVDDVNWMRRISNTVTVTGGGSLGVMGIDTDPSDAAWTSEVSDTDASADSAMKFGKRELSPNLLIKRLDVSRTMLARLSNVDSVVAERLAYKVGRTEEAAFLEGTGASQPLGVFTASADGITTDRDVLSGATAALSADGLIEAQHTLKASYRRNAGWVMSREAVKQVRKLKDGDNRYLWGRGDLNAAEPDTLLASPIYEAEEAPGHDADNDWDAGDYVAVYGDFNFYQVATAVNLELLRDNLSSAGKNKVRFFVYHEVDAMPLLAEAFVRVKLSS
jgi:HK97 family phage major capsid protein